jgi:hypothetical protein
MRPRNAQFDFGTGFAPDTQLRTDLSGAFAHSGQAIVARATVGQEFRRNAHPVIPNPQPEQSFPIADCYFDLLCPRVRESIS